MALKATIFKADIDVSDLDRGYYARHSLTLAQHPSETVERLMLRLAAFVLHASDTLAFTRGLCADDEPELWQKNYSDEIELWVELGEPDERGRCLTLFDPIDVGGRRWPDRHRRHASREHCGQKHD